MQQVEREVGDRSAAPPASVAQLVGVGQAVGPLRPAPVEHRERASTRTASPASSGKLASSRPTPSTNHVAAPGDLGRADERQRPQSAPRRLEEVRIGVERLGEGPRQHRSERRREVREDRDVGLEPQRQLVAHRAAMVAGRLGRVAAPSPRRAPTGGSSAESARPDDLYKLRVPTDPRISPDGTRAIVTVQSSAPKGDGYRHSLWVVPVDAGSGEPRQLTLGAKNDTSARWSPDGRSIAFLSDRRHIVEEEPDALDKKDREDGTQVYLLSLDGGEARRLTDLPRGVGGFEWSPDGSKLVVTSTSHRANRKDDRKARGLDRKREPIDPLESDYRYIDRLGYMFNGPGFIYDQVAHLWLVDVASGAATRLTDGPTGDDDPAWSPDGTRIAFATRLNRDYDIYFRSDIVVIDVASGKRTRITGGPEPIFFVPAWLPDGKTIAALGGRPHNGYRNDVWLFSADGRGDARRRSQHLGPARHHARLRHGQRHHARRGVEADPVVGWPMAVVPCPARRRLPVVADRDLRRRARAADRRPALPFVVRPGRSPGRPPAGGADPLVGHELADVWVRDGAKNDLRRVTSFNAEALADVELVEPQERHVTVDGRDIQGWFIPGRRPDGARKAVRCRS